MMDKTIPFFKALGSVYIFKYNIYISPWDKISLNQMMYIEELIGKIILT